MTGPGTSFFSVRDLSVRFETPSGTLQAVDGLSLDLSPRETLGIVGESGSGKTVSMLAVLRLLRRGSGVRVKGSAILDGEDLLQLPERRLRQIRGRKVGFISQNPQTSFNPVYTIGEQIAEAIRAHENLGRGELRRRVAELLDLVGIPRSAERAQSFPHEFSGGMRQRAMIAMAIANRPAMVIADEPTTALDVTIQAQVLEVLREAAHETGAATIIITHDLGVIAELADRVVVMYAGRAVETASVGPLFDRPLHPYTVGLLRSDPGADVERGMLYSIPGQPPNLFHVPSGCPFHPRCDLGRARTLCATSVPPLLDLGDGDRSSACHYVDEVPLLNRDRGSGGRIDSVSAGGV